MAHTTVSPRRSAADYLPARLNLASLRRAAKGCRGCDLYRRATQTVFGAGPRRAEIMLVGEMPGDEEDRQGKPFVGPAGRVLDEALGKVGLARSDVFVTNAVKHFNWEPRGKRRLHKKPRRIEVTACRPWLEAEIATVEPKLIVCLGATAAQSLLGSSFRISRQRGQMLATPWSRWLMATHHPSAVLRAPEKAVRDRMRGELARDLRGALRRMASRVFQPGWACRLSNQGTTSGNGEPSGKVDRSRRCWSGEMYMADACNSIDFTHSNQKACANGWGDSPCGVSRRSRMDDSPHRAQNVSLKPGRT